MGPSEAGVPCSSGDRMGMVLQTQGSFAPLAVFESRPRSKSSPAPGSAHGVWRGTQQAPKQINTNFKDSATCQGGFKDCSSAPITSVPSSGTRLGSQVWERVPMFKKQSFMLEGAKGKSPVLSCQIQPRVVFVLQTL